MTIIAVQAIALEELLAAHGSAVNSLPFDSLLDCFGDLAKTVSRQARQFTDRTAAKTHSCRTMPRRATAGSAPSPMATAEITDEALLTAYIDGDRQAFAALLERYRTELHGFLARFLGSSAAADDVFQETFLQVHLAASTFDSTRHFKPWLFTIAANKARDWHRRQKRRRAVSLDAPLGGDPDGTRLVDIMESKAEVPGNLLESAETRNRVKDVVDSMPALYREVLQLNYFQKMSYQQIAEVLGVPLGTVKSRLHAAVATFAESWKTADARSLRTSSANKEFKG
jgi:RNA polymerase sigma-70 factor (ECF subfamily)